LPDGKTVSYGYDVRGRLTSLTDWASQSASYSYDGASRPASRTANGITTTQAYDAASRLTLLEHKAGATTLGRFAYTLNARGDRTQAYEILARAGGGQDEHTQVYGYDGAQRVMSAIRYPGTATSGTPQRSDTYSYDVASNRLSQAVALNGGAPTTTNYTYDDANRLSNAGFAYDNAGRMTSDGTNTYAWDRANRLLSRGTSSYAYDGLGRRVSQTVSGTTTRYTNDHQCSLWKTMVETTGANVTRYVYDMSEVVSQQRPDGSWNGFLDDGLGSIRGIVNASASPLESRLYAPYGDPIQLRGSSQSNLGYTGQPTDVTGMVYLRARYMSPTFGQFLSLDPVESMNRYNYADGNPINLTDIAGRLPGRAMVWDDGNVAVAPGTRLPKTTATGAGTKTTVGTITGTGGQATLISGSSGGTWSGQGGGTKHGGNGGSPTSTAEILRGVYGDATMCPRGYKLSGGVCVLVVSDDKKVPDSQPRHYAQNIQPCPIPDGYGSNNFVLSDCIEMQLSCMTKKYGSDVYGLYAGLATNQCQAHSLSLGSTVGTCSVEVRAYNTSARLNHTFIVFTGTDGRQFGYSGQPTNVAGASGLSEQISGNIDAFGPLTVYTGEYNPDFVDYPFYETAQGPRAVIRVVSNFPISEPSNCSRLKSCLDAEAGRINNLPLDILRYYPVTGPNSNTVTRTILSSCGLDEFVPSGQGDILTGAPGWYNTSLSR
jgi:RHS repeat-associated protein